MFGDRYLKSLRTSLSRRQSNLVSMEMLGASASALPSETEVLEGFFGSSLPEGPSLNDSEGSGLCPSLFFLSL